MVYRPADHIQYARPTSRLTFLLRLCHHATDVYGSIRVPTYGRITCISEYRQRTIYCAHFLFR